MFQIPEKGDIKSYNLHFTKRKLKVIIVFGDTRSAVHHIRVRELVIKSLKWLTHFEPQSNQWESVSHIIEVCETLALLGTNWNNGLKASVMYWNLNNVASNRNYNIGDHFTALYSLKNLRCLSPFHRVFLLPHLSTQVGHTHVWWWNNRHFLCN